MAAYRVHVAGRNVAYRSAVRPGTGRHRLGTPGLRYCGDLRGVPAGLAGHRGRGRRRAPTSPARLSAGFAVMLLAAVVVGTVLVSGWYAAAGAAVIAGMVTH